MWWENRQLSQTPQMEVLCFKAKQPSGPVGILHKYHVSCTAKVLTSLWPGSLPSLSAPTMSFHLQQDFMEQTEHGIARCLHISLTSLLVAPDKSTALLVAEVSAMLNINGSFILHPSLHLTEMFCFSSQASAACLSLSVSPVLLTPPLAAAWIDPTSVFPAYLAFIAQNTALCSATF